MSWTCNNLSFLPLFGRGPTWTEPTALLQVLTVERLCHVLVCWECSGKRPHTPSQIGQSDGRLCHRLSCHRTTVRTLCHRSPPLTEHLNLVCVCQSLSQRLLKQASDRYQTCPVALNSLLFMFNVHTLGGMPVCINSVDVYLHVPHADNNVNI